MGAESAIYMEVHMTEHERLIREADDLSAEMEKEIKEILEEYEEAKALLRIFSMEGSNNHS